MARLPYLSAEDLAPDQSHLLARPIALFRVLANRPELLRHIDAMGDWIRWNTALDGRLRELAIVYVGLLAQSPYEYSHHVKIAMDFGATEDDLDALRAHVAGRPHGLGSVEQTVVAATRHLVQDGELPDALWSALSGLLERDAVIDLIATVSYYCMVVRVISAFGVEVEPEYQRYLDRFPISPEAIPAGTSPTTVERPERG